MSFFIRYNKEKGKGYEYNTFKKTKTKWKELLEF